MNTKEKCFAILAHGSYLLCGIGFLILPIILYIFSGSMCKLAKHHIKQAIRAQFFVILLCMITMCLSIWFGEATIMCLLGLEFLVWMISSIVAMVKVLGNEDYNYPLL